MRIRILLATVFLAVGVYAAPIQPLRAGPIGTPAGGVPSAPTGGLSAPGAPPQFSKAVSAFRRGDLPATLQWLRQANREHPRLAPAEIILATMFFSDEQPGKGREVLEQAAVKHPTDPEPHLIFGDLAFRQGRLSDAHVQYQRGAQLTASFAGSEKRRDELETRAVVGLARVAEARGQLETAQRRYAALLELAPDHAQAHFRLGNVLFAMGRPEEAVAQLREAAGLLQDAPSPALTMAQLYKQAGQSEEAQQWLERAIDESPEDPRPHLAMANWQLEARNAPEAALPFVERAAELSPESVEASRLRGLIAWSMGDYAQAERVFESVALKTPSDPQINNYFAAVLAEKPSPQTRRAWELVQLTASSNPQSAETAATMGWVAYQRGELERAEQYLTRAARAGHDRDTDYYLARTLFRRGRIAQAHKALQRALTGEGMFVHARQAEAWRREIGAPASR